MKRLLTVLLAAGLLIAAGCKPKQQLREYEPLNMDVATSNDMIVTMDVAKDRYLPGELINVNVRVRNISNHPMTIQSNSTSHVRVIAYRQTPLGWDTLSVYPVGTAPQNNAWALGAGEMTIFPVPVRVGPIWPQGDYVKLVAEVNGRPDVAPAVQVFILPQSSDSPTGTGVGRTATPAP